MKIHINGQQQPYSDNLSLAELLKTLAIDNKTAGIAIALNEKMTPRDLWEQIQLQAGDRVEIVMAVQGG